MLNGEERTVGEGATIRDLVAAIGLTGRRVAVELNRHVLAAETWDRTELHEDDVVEIVHFVGGG